MQQHQNVSLGNFTKVSQESSC